jgi:hypothetical protein
MESFQSGLPIPHVLVVVTIIISAASIYLSHQPWAEILGCAARSTQVCID